jgi:hypothetical protein
MRVLHVCVGTLFHFVLIDIHILLALSLALSLSRAAIDRTTAFQFSCGKAFDISNATAPSSTFPYPILFMEKSSTTSPFCHQPSTVLAFLGVNTLQLFQATLAPFSMAKA